MISPVIHNEMRKQLYDMEERITRTCEEIEKLHGEFSQQHQYWLNLRASIRDTIEKLTGK